MTLRSRLVILADDALFGPETGARLVVVQIGLATLVGLRILVGPYRDLAGTPDLLFDPPPYLWFLESMPSAGALLALQVVGLAAALAAVVRWRPGWTLPIAWACLLVLAGLRGGRFKVQHNDLLLLWACVPFLLCHVPASWHDRSPVRRHGWQIRSAVAIAASAYGMTGYHKLHSTGLDWAVGENLRYVMLWARPISDTWGDVSMWIAETPWAYKGIGIVILTTELAFPLAVVLRRLQPWFAFAAGLLHLATYLFLGLDYSPWALTLLLLFVDWPEVAGRLARRRGSRRSPGGSASVTPAAERG